MVTSHPHGLYDKPHPIRHETQTAVSETAAVAAAVVSVAMMIAKTQKAATTAAPNQSRPVTVIQRASPALQMSVSTPTLAFAWRRQQ